MHSHTQADMPLTTIVHLLFAVAYLVVSVRAVAAVAAVAAPSPVTDNSAANIVDGGQTNSNLTQEMAMEHAAQRLSVALNITSPMYLADGDTVSIQCSVTPAASHIWWTYEDTNITELDRNFVVDGEQIDQQTEPNEGDDENDENVDMLTTTSNLQMSNVQLEDTGTYKCHAMSAPTQEKTESAPRQVATASVFLNITLGVSIVQKSHDLKVKIYSREILYCLFRGSPITNVYWLRNNENITFKELANRTKTVQFNETILNTTLQIKDASRKDNGTYYCKASGNMGQVFDTINFLVLDTPHVSIDMVKAVGADTIYMNWTINDGNDPITKYLVQFMKKGTDAWQYYAQQIAVNNMSYLFKNFESGTEYKLHIAAINGQGEGHYDETPFVRTLDKDPDFVPQIEVKGVSSNSITIGWSVPPAQLKDHVHYYELVAQADNSTTINEAVHSAKSNNSYWFVNLNAATTYKLKVRACNEFTGKCANYSKDGVNATTMDGLAGAPINAKIDCHIDAISHTSFLFVQWQPPLRPNGKIIYYQVILEGKASFRNEMRANDSDTFGPKIKSVDERGRNATFTRIPPNMNYTVRVSATTRTKRHGEPITLTCTMPPAAPDKDKMSKFTWNKLEEHGKFVFKMTLPKISDRSGKICCYRIFMVRLGNHQGLSQLPQPQDIILQSYAAVHSNVNGGAYVAEMFSNDMMLSAVFLGDGYTLNVSNSECLRCVGIKKPTATVPSPSPTAISSSHATVPNSNSTKITAKNSNETSNSIGVSLAATGGAKLNQIRRRRRRRNVDMMKISDENAVKVDPNVPYDGVLDIDSTYTSFVEVIVHGLKAKETLAAYSNYLDIQQPVPDAHLYVQANVNGVSISHIVYVLIALTTLAFMFMFGVCAVHRYSKNQGDGVELVTFQNSFRHLCRSFRGRHQLISSCPPNMSPIGRDDLVTAYVERHRNCEYGFQQEFEQLPDKFSDRTTRASDLRENVSKNRYPDIKAYDQTRVKLSQVDGMPGSDYINANVVLGYKERKKFICAQGPMESTVNDFWRMIWELRLELVMMLTNLEEYSKAKCAKYWPGKSERTKTYNNISVTHVTEVRYSDYMIRTLKVTKLTESGDSKDKEERTVTQYHFLTWKDFMAPEHPNGILKFIKRMNEAHSMERGAILVHCSAGVGRTGTLVALDSLLQQLRDENQVSIFNTVCDLRHQRNFLVQNLKQYMFIYRALMEVAQYGDTEMSVKNCKAAIEELKKVPDNDGKSRMCAEFDKLKGAIEERKASQVGTLPDNAMKNRCDSIIPYDHNRVILTPLPGVEHSTYINASFVEGYDNNESFIIAQDPLEATIADFWRMIVEQGVETIVMLSDLGSLDNPKKCPKYWPEDQMAYNHVRVKYLLSESCPYYTRREMSVTNTKVDEVVMVVHFQYHGWPTVEGQVPEVTRGLIELADKLLNLHMKLSGDCSIASASPIVVHCSNGSDRSSMFVGLCNLIQQLRAEKQFDVFATARKLRSQRSSLLTSFAQYEFLYRAISNYVDLHHLNDDESD